MSSVKVYARCPWCGELVTNNDNAVTFQSCTMSGIYDDHSYIVRKRGSRYKSIGGTNPAHIKGVMHRACFDKVLDYAWRYNDSNE